MDNPWVEWWKDVRLEWMMLTSSTVMWQLITLGAALLAAFVMHRLTARYRDRWMGDEKNASGPAEGRRLRAIVWEARFPLFVLLFGYLGMSIYGATDRPMYTLRRLVTLFWFIAGYQLLATAVTILLPESDARRIIRRVLLPLLAALGVLHLVGLLAALWAWASQPLITFAADTLTAADLGVAAAIMATFWLAGLLARELMVRHVVPRTETDPGLARTVAGFMQFGIILAGLWIAIASLGLQLSNLTILISALTVGIGFGLQDVIKNIMGGLILLVEGHVKPNDIIKVNDQSGRVEAIGIRSTTVRAWDGSQVIVPNADLISEKVYDQTELLRIEIEVNVSTEINPREVEAVLRQIAAQHPAVVADPAPSVLFSAFGANTFDLTLYCFVGDRADRVDTESDLRYAIVETFRAQGIEMPTPQYEVHLMQAG